MLILVDVRPLQYIGPDDERRHFILSCLSGLVKGKHHEWIFLADKNVKFEWPGTESVRVVAKKSMPGRLGWRWWYDRQVPKAMREISADVLISTSGIAAGSVSQCLWMPIHVKKGPDAFYGGLYRRRWKKGVKIAQSILCFSEADKAAMANVASGLAGKTCILTLAPDGDIAPSTWEEKKQSRAEFSDGKDFFFSDLSLAGDREAVNLLKAFSLFKKRQRSNLQLVLTGKPTGSGRRKGGRNARKKGAESFRKSLDSYKFRQEVHWITDAEEIVLRNLKGACYCLILPSREDDLGLALLNAWKAKLPVILCRDGDVPGLPGELGGEGAALFVKDNAPETLAAALMKIYTDEGLRESMIAGGLERLALYPTEGPTAEIEKMLRKG